MKFCDFARITAGRVQGVDQYHVMMIDTPAIVTARQAFSRLCFHAQFLVQLPHGCCNGGFLGIGASSG
ncbi:hypothetical protein A9404_02790 [Halothiobacillus diazotrophicus]|uniref:Uncharacterized protein n=1 Tax=Halothiobacillus diazotrophicus TaxID=1860122 RepID=A0A191ZF09_9GAMM|nr:hypothetical protein A9404_02790 [Halothiobacillus diazotrophicus]